MLPGGEAYDAIVREFGRDDAGCRRAIIGRSS